MGSQISFGNDNITYIKGPEQNVEKQKVENNYFSYFSYDDLKHQKGRSNNFDVFKIVFHLSIPTFCYSTFQP